MDSLCCKEIAKISHIPHYHDYVQHKSRIIRKKDGLNLVQAKKTKDEQVSDDFIALTCDNALWETL